MPRGSMIGRSAAFTASAGLAAILALAFVPSEETGGMQMYGMAEVVHRDTGGSVLSSQTVHNRLLDAGEDFIVDAVFRSGEAVLTDGLRIDTICLSDIDGGIDDVNFNEGDAASVFAAPSGPAGANACKSVPDAETVETAAGTALIGPLTFTAGTDFDAGETIASIAVCIEDAASVGYEDCAAVGTAFAATDVGDVTPVGTDTVDVSYTFNISSPDT
ncbi:hypothetical protein CENSYa_1909 [Cenarchaeum symbiosum A]|uniref:Uncharacterized protein n=1 Tax=Cenarchaeum symbiosum (strain A) TaxID=414004 RepID=A0RYV1_CENSY|nr:hypothetical protein CENSYa_1909 [Cenarchaeum symbiosum A]